MKDFKHIISVSDLHPNGATEEVDMDEFWDNIRRSLISSGISKGKYVVVLFWIKNKITAKCS